MSMSLKVIVPPHPLIKHWLSILREKNTPNILYSTGYEQIGKWLTYEALRNWLPFKKTEIESEQGTTEGIFIDTNYPIRIIAQIPEGLSLWQGSREIIPNATLTLGNLPKEIKDNEGIIIYSEIISKGNNPLATLKLLRAKGVKSNRIILISCISSDKGLNEIAKEFPDQNIYTSCIDEEEETKNLIKPGIGNPILRLSTQFE